MHRARSRATILVIGVFNDVKGDRVVEDLSSRTAQDVLDEHLGLDENWGGEVGFEPESRRIPSYAPSYHKEGLPRRS